VENASVANRYLTRFNMEWQNIMDVTNSITVSRMVTRSALHREESRGAHYRNDFPETNNDNWLVNIFLKKDDEIGIVLSTQPVALTRLKREEIGNLKY
jgi:succinate dehydrogenase / fumarate reductase flavoprotein subunit/fumarate reductase flavoprotein subunit